ncbi:MAG: major capsid protein [Sporomusa sp.]
MITLEQAKVGMADKVDQQVIDEFRRGSYLLDSLTFDNAVSPGTGGSTLAYGYIKLKTPSTASFRALNSEYTNVEALREPMTAYCKIFGGSFKLDRVIINTSGAVDELAFQMSEKVKGAINLFHYTAINGDMATNQDEFDGLDTLLTGSSTEYDEGTLDVSTSALLDAGYNNFLDMMDDFVAGMDGTPTMFLTNSKLATKIKGVARRAGYYSQIEDAFGRSVSMWNNIPIIDLQNYFDPATAQTVPVVPIDASGTTSLYAVQIAQDGFHGISPAGSNIITTNTPDLNAPGAIKEGDVEMVAGVVLKNSLKAGVFRNIKVQ